MHWCCGTISAYLLSEASTAGKVWSYLMCVPASELWSAGKMCSYVMYVSVSELWSAGKIWSYVMYVSVSELWSAGMMWIGLSHVCLCVRALVLRQDVDRAISCVSLRQRSGPQVIFETHPCLQSEPFVSVCIGVLWFWAPK